MRVADLQLIAKHLYKMGPDEIIHRYILKHERPMILNEAHTSVIGGNYFGKATVHKILQARLWWATLHAYILENIVATVISLKELENCHNEMKYH